MMERRAGRAALRIGTSVFFWLCPAGAHAQELRRVTLDEAVQLAWQAHPVAIAAQVGVDNAETERLEAMGSFLPSLTLNGVYGNSSNQRFDQSTGRLVSTSYTAQTQASWELFSGGRRLASYRAARAGVDAADAGLVEARFETALLATSAFYAAAAAVELVSVNAQRLARATQQLVFANTRLDVGTATRSDVLRAELELGNAELALIDAQSGLRTARLSLGRVMGVAGEVATVEAVLPIEPPPLPPLDTLAARAEQASPVARSARAAHDATQASRMSTYAFYLPTLRLNGGYDWFSPTFPPQTQSWSLRLTASLPLFNGFQREANVARLAAAERLAGARARDATIAARAGALNAALLIESEGQRVGIARRAVALAQEDLRVQEERYQISSATIVELQTSQVALADAESAFVRARQALGVAVATLEAVLGERIGS
jgi:outer membrane protein TolC